MSLSVKIGARSSRLSRAQVDEVWRELTLFHPHVTFEPVWMQTQGDLDWQTSLRTLDKTDFFTREIEEAQLAGNFRLSIHSAKDLPATLRPGLTIVALTRGVDPSDSLVHNRDLLHRARIGVSSERRIQTLLQWRPDFECVDIRGDIDHRLALVDDHVVDGVVIAEAALIRLGLTHRRRQHLSGDTAPLQGRLAVIARDGDDAMRQLFECIDEKTDALSRH